MAAEIRQAVIMVGGKGTRLLPLTNNKPKPILPVLNKPCLRYLIESLASAGIKEIILACGYKSAQMVNAIGDGSDLGIRIEYSYEDEPLGTGGAMKQIEYKLDEVFVAANGDVFADICLRDEIEAHFSSESKVTIALTEVTNPCEFGIARLDESNRILEFKEKPKPEEVFSNLINAGVYIINREVLADIPPGTFFDFSKDLMPILLTRGDRIQGFLLKGTWRDVGRPADLLGVNLHMASKMYDEIIWGGKYSESSVVKKPLYFGDETWVNDSELTVVVALDGCTIEDSKITNSLIMNGCEITSAKIENSILGEGCVVHEGAHIENSVLGDGTVVKAGEKVVRNNVF